jgi:hypothetical protein
MLLLGMCIAAPRYWVAKSRSQSAGRSTTDRFVAEHRPCLPLPFVARSSTSGVQVFLSAPTPQTAPEPSVGRLSKRPLAPAGRLVLIPPQELPPAPPTLADVFPGVDLGAVLRKLGRHAAGWQPGELTAPLARLVSDRLKRLPPPPQIVSSSPTSAESSPVFSSPPTLVGSLLVTSPTQRLAMVPDRGSKVPRIEGPRLDAPQEPWDIVVDVRRGPTWRKPLALIDQLEQLARCRESSSWANRALRQFGALADERGLSDREAADRLDRIRALSVEARQLAATIDDPRLATEVRRAHFAIERRVAVWSPVRGIRLAELDVPHAQFAGDERLRDALSQLDELTGESERGAQWRDYLLSDALAQAADQGERMSLAERRALARQILARVSTGRLSARQRQFLASPPVAAVAGQMRHWAGERVNVDRLVANLEAYEQSGSPRVAQQIASDCRRLEWSPDDLHRRLADHIEEHYRNANFRVAITAELLDQLLPEQEPSGFQPIRERIVGTPVRGRQQTVTVLTTRLVPDENFLRLALVAQGNVDSHTVAHGDGARLWTRGSTDFHARKLVTVAADGMRVYPATAVATSQSRLVGVRTDYDNLPLVGKWARNEAHKQFHQNRSRACMMVQRKVSDRAVSDLDAEAGPYLARLRDKIATSFDDLRQTGVHIEPISLATTERRIVARLRVAGDEQLAAHTPRNRAPGDSLASMQLHESVLTNLAQCLDLDGQRLTAVELRDRIIKELGLDESDPTDEVPSDTVFHFAYEDALRFQFREGQLELTVELIELVHDRRPTRRFKVHAFYEPRIDGMRLTLARTGALGIEGRIRTGDRARLHAVFNKVLSEDQEIPILDPEKMGVGPIEDVMITQTVLEDGWLGVALGPKTEGRTAERYRSLR